MKRHRTIFITPPRLRFDDIRRRADEFRNRYVIPPDQLPIPIDEIVELTFGLIPIPIPGLLDETTDGFLTNDLKCICIDRDLYLDPRKENRLRFTFAHEIGHLILHANEIKQCKFRTPDDWIYFHQDFLREDQNWFEQHAHEFAGRLLVPKPALETRVGAMSAEIEKYRKMGGNNEEALIDSIARIICTDFGVSSECLAKRIRTEKLQRYFYKRS